MAIYASLPGAYWSLPLQDWARQPNPLFWKGVSWNRVEGSTLPRCVGLNLQNNIRSSALYGKLPLALFDLTALEQLNLTGHQLSGDLKEGWEKFQRLNTLLLRDNLFTGNPTAALAQCSELTILELGLNRFSGPVAPGIGKLAKLRYLNLAGNQFSGELPDLSKLVLLSQLSLSNNQLEGNPLPGLSNCTMLEEVYIDQNKFSGNIPASLSKLKHVFILQISENQFSGDLSATAGLTELKFLFAAYNKFEGALPTGLDKLTKLKWLDLGHNEYTGDAFPALSGLRTVSNLDVSDNQSLQTCSVVQHFDDYVSLENLDLDNTNLRGCVFPEFKSTSSKIWYIDLDSTGLSGALPASITRLPNLQELHFNGNDISSLPELKRLAKLRALSAGGNRLDMHDLLPYATIPDYIYDPQQPLGKAWVLSLLKGAKVTLVAEGGADLVGVSTTWWKDDAATSASNKELSLVMDKNWGSYTPILKATALPRLRLENAAITLAERPDPKYAPEFPQTIDASVTEAEGCSYTWESGETGPLLTVEKAGTYTVTATCGTRVRVEQKFNVPPPWMSTKPKKGEVFTFDNVLFKQGTASMLSGSASELDALSQFMNEHPKVKILLMGHTDNQGSRKGNKKLSEERTKVVKKYLQGRGVSGRRIKTVGYGGARPVASNLAEETRRLNRRVEFKVIAD